MGRSEIALAIIDFVVLLVIAVLLLTAHSGFALKISVIFFLFIIFQIVYEITIEN